MSGITCRFCLKELKSWQCDCEKSKKQLAIWGVPKSRKHGRKPGRPYHHTQKTSDTEARTLENKKRELNNGELKYGKRKN